ncbi:MAG: carbohydrate kinase [Actinomycetota bacterium]|nr:carbohydrate kinase [Actinomycetota bacterium]
MVSTRPILCLGEAIVDLICERPLAAGAFPKELVPHPGGALANVAVAVSRSGAPAALTGGVGDDQWGRWLAAGLESEGVSTRWLVRLDGADTPVGIVIFGPDNEPRFQIYGEHIGPTMEAASDRLPEAVASSQALVIGSNTMVGAVEREVTRRAVDLAGNEGVPVLFDPNFRPNRWKGREEARRFCQELAARSAVIKCNRIEAELMTGEADPLAAARALARSGPRLVVVTDGAGKVVSAGAAEATHQPPSTDVVSPLGAGDAFMGALAAGLARLDWDFSRAGEILDEASGIAMSVCAHWGAQG